MQFYRKPLALPFALLLLTTFESCQPKPDSIPSWPPITREKKPWTRWWWHGSSLTKEGITAEMEAYQKAGLGGLEITPIYGVVGYEDKFVDYLSPQWMELLLHTLKEGERLDMGIDMATGTGWPFGGPSVNDEDACKSMNHKIYTVKSGKRLSEKIEFIQQSYLRAVANQVYEVSNRFSTSTVALGEDREPLKQSEGKIKQPSLKLEPKKIDIKNLVQPISANKNLQALALDQVRNFGLDRSGGKLEFVFRV